MIDAAKITILVDNTAPEGLAAEHGFSAWIEVGDRRILFDTGLGAALPLNAAALGVDVGTATDIVLSHGHYDHAGALAWVLARNDHAVVWAHPGAVRARYSVREGVPRAINVPAAAVAALDALPPARWRAVTGPVALAPGVGLTGPIPRVTGYEDTGGPFFLDPEGAVADPLEDDLGLWIATGQGVVVVTGCGHAGVINTVELARTQSGVARVHAVLGGFHLVAASAARLEATAAAFAALAPALIAPCHCTSAPAIAALEAALGASVQPPRAGAILDIAAA